jgi:hypothetical protein
VKYTIVMQQPEAIVRARDDDYRECVYIAVGVKGDTLHEAVVAAQDEAYEAAARDWGKRAMRQWQLSISDFETIVAFEGECRVVAFAGSPGMS